MILYDMIVYTDIYIYIYVYVYTYIHISNRSFEKDIRTSHSSRPFEDVSVPWSQRSSQDGGARLPQMSGAADDWFE